MAIRAIIWDLGGVLVRTEDRAPREGLARRLGMTRPELEELVFSGPSGRKAQHGLLAVDQHWQNLRQELKLSAEEIAAFQKEFWGGDRLDGELVDYIRELHKRYRTALLSNAFSDLRQMAGQRWNILDAFDVLIISSEEGVMKPEKRIYELAVERLEVAPHEAVFVDDFLHNVEGAQVAGLHALQFRSPTQIRAELDQLLESDGHA
jgi:epoxide hydrolase-like predicted phosphatase